MFCPKCGCQLESEGSLLVCRAGAMQLSASLARGLTEVFIARSRQSEPRPLPFAAGGAWFCPGCGVPIRQQSGLLVCPGCHCELDEFIPALVELHPHRGR